MSGRDQLSSIDLRNRENVRLDLNAKTISYFCKKYPVTVSTIVIRQLKAIAKTSGNQNVRLCLHFKPSDLFHEMIILEHPKKYYRPHKHVAKGESYHVIEGSMAIFIFNENGQIIDHCILGRRANVMYRIGTNLYHAVMPLSKYVIYHESKPGPFTGEQDSQYPLWAPDGIDEEKARSYSKALRSVLRLQERKNY